MKSELPYLIFSDLKGSLQKPGCPICRLKMEAEERYLRSLLWEHVNDGDARARILRGLGFCPKHTWQAGALEVEGFGDAMGNSIIYLHLLEVVQKRLASFQKRSRIHKGLSGSRVLSHLITRPQRKRALTELEPTGPCRVCQVGAQSERDALFWLGKALVDPGSSFRDLYTHSDRLCLTHLKEIARLAGQPAQGAVDFLVEDMLTFTARLRQDLEGYMAKRSWNRHAEALEPAEEAAWMRALQLFGGIDAGLPPASLAAKLPGQTVSE
jgi:hypothetical protein